MKRRFLDFVELAPRSQKPRVKGLSTFGDRGYPMEWIRGMLDAYGDYIDVVKFIPTTSASEVMIRFLRLLIFKARPINF